MIFERTKTYSLYRPHSICFRMAVRSTKFRTDLNNLKTQKSIGALKGRINTHMYIYVLYHYYYYYCYYYCICVGTYIYMYAYKYHINIWTPKWQQVLEPLARILLRRQLPAQLGAKPRGQKSRQKTQEVSGTVDSKKLEHGCRMIYAGFPSSFGLGLEAVHVKTFLPVL